MADAHRFAATPMSEILRYDDTAVVITGGAKGIGYAMACRFAELGATLTLIDIDPELIHRSSQIALKYGVKVNSVYGDVRDSTITETAASNAYFSEVDRLSGLTMQAYIPQI